MSFNGRVVTTGKVSGSVSGVFSSGAVMFNVTTLNGINIAPGTKVKITYAITTMQFPFGFTESDNGVGIPTAIIGVVEGATGTLVHIIADSTADGVCAIAVATGNHVFTYTVEIISDTLIDNPVEAIKHIKQCQNWSELVIVADWGKEVVGEALIKTSGEGSFNSTTLDEIKTLKIARQIFDYDRAWSDDLVQSLCEQFFLISYQDENGYECLKSLLTKENPSTTITFGDIVGPVGDMIEPRMSDIYCAPIINYAYDYATEKYTKQLRVEKVWESTFNASYTQGIEAADAEDIWQTCHALWGKVRQIEPMPSNLTDRIWAPDYATALWCLKQQLKLMTLKRCSFSVGYTVGRKWDIGTHFKLQLPHETNNHAIECVVEEIVKKKDQNSVTVQVILLDVIESSFFFEE